MKPANVNLLCRAFHVGRCFKSKPLHSSGLFSSFMNKAALDSVKMVLVVRSDLGMGKGKVAAQCAHAAVQCYINGMKTNSTLVHQWIISGQPKVVVRVSSEEELISLYRAAKSINLVCSIIQDAGKTQLTPGTATVLGIGPDNSSHLDNITGHLKLF